MGRDSRDPQGDEWSDRYAASDGRRAPSGRGDTPPGGRDFPRNASSGRLASNGRSGGGNTPRPGGTGSSGRTPTSGRGGGGGLIRSPLQGVGESSGMGASGSRSASGPGPARGRSSNPPRRDQSVQRGRGSSANDGASGQYSAQQPSARGGDGGGNGGRGIGRRVRDMGRNVSEQFSVIMERAGRMVHGDSEEYPAARARRFDSRYMPSRGSISVPSALAASDAFLPYRRSRSRMLARKWRLRRIRGNPVLYFTGIFFLVLFVSALVGGVGAGGAFAAQYYAANQGAIRNAWISGNSHSTVIYDRNGTPLYALQRNTGFQFNVPYNFINPTLINATVAVEDRTFWNNWGVDLYRTAGALFADLSKGGQAAQGGSTITQQLVKQLVLHNDEKTYTRKLDEAIMSIGMTKDNHFDPNGYTKQQIMQMYLNNIYYDDQNTGIEAAARNYFGYQQIVDPKTKNVVEMANQQLTLAQIAILVRIPNYPTLYYPLSWSCKQAPCSPTVWDSPNAQGNEWNVFNGATTVLDNMRIAGYIDQATEDKTLGQVSDILTNQQIYHWKGLSEGTTNSEEAIKKAPHFVDYVITQLITDFGMVDPDTVAAAGLSVYTTLDYNLEQYIENDAAMYINGEPSGPNKGMFTRYWYCNNSDNGGENNDPCTVPALSVSDNVHNAAAVAIDPHTGDILAMMGSVDYGSLDKQVLGYINMATTPRSMGSSFKPLVYSTAFQMGWYPGLMLQDIPLCFPGLQTPPTPGSKWIPDPSAPACTTSDHMGQYYTTHNYDATSFSGSAPIREMLANSLNIPATETQYFVGANGDTGDGFLQMLGRLGVPTCQSCTTAGYVSGARLGPTTALGTQEIPLLSQTSAYGAFATGGLHVPTRAILRIDDSQGNTIYTAPTPHPGQAMSPEAAYMITSILTDNEARAGDFKVHNPLYLPLGPNPLGGPMNSVNYPYMAAKTGTAQGDTGPSGIITMAYSPYMVLGVWAGNTDPHDDLNPNIIGITGAGYIVHDAMAWAVQKYHWPLNQGFAVPPDMAYAQFNCTDGLAPYKGTDLATWQFDWSNPGHVTPSWCPLQPYPGYPNSTPLYVGHQTAGIWPDIDWIIKGQYPLVS